jgi:hypothetical protein
MSISSRPDYGAKGCCGPAVLAGLTLLAALVVLVGGWIA